MHTVSAREVGLAPVAPEERVQSLDVLRGLALFGILVVNILVYAPKPSSPGDWLAAKVISIAAEGSFYPLFSLLFGVGFAVFLDRAASRGAKGVVLYLRRLMALLAIAVLQIILLDEQNILVRYAFLGLPLLLFWRASARLCFAAALICLALAVVRSPANQELLEREMRDPVLAAHARQQRAANQTHVWARRGEWERVKATHSFLEAAEFRMRWQVPNQLAWSTNLRRNPTLFHILAMFLLGAAAWRSRIIVEAHKYRRLMIHLFGWGLAVGLAGNLALNVGARGDSISFFASRPIITVVVTLLADTALALCYASAIIAVVVCWGRCVASSPCPACLDRPDGSYELPVAIRGDVTALSSLRVGARRQVAVLGLSSDRGADLSFPHSAQRVVACTLSLRPG